MTDNYASLQNSNVGGKAVLRDDKSFNIISEFKSSNYLESLYDKFQKEFSQNKELKSICDDLNYFYSKVENEKIVGLENKLIAGNKQKILDYAMTVKEKFHKKLMKTSQYSEIAQDINVYILAKVRRGFMMEIYTMICNNESEEKIHALITERIINPVKAELGINIFKYDEDDIMGMIFFLTGNCHIKWSV